MRGLSDPTSGPDAIISKARMKLEVCSRALLIPHDGSCQWSTSGPSPTDSPSDGEAETQLSGTRLCQTAENDREGQSPDPQ